MLRWFRRLRASRKGASEARPGGVETSGSVGTTASAGPGHPDGTAPGLVGPSATPEERRFAQVYAADRVGPMPYPNQASPDVGAARGRVRSLVDELLPHGVDEGTGAALDPLIASWTSGWLARIDSQHTDHQAVIDRLVGGARQQLAEAEACHERDRRALAIARRDYDEARDALISSPPGSEAEPTGRSVGRSVGRSAGRRSGDASAAGRATGRRGGGLLSRLIQRGSGRRGIDGAAEGDGPDGGSDALSRTDRARSPHDAGPPEPATRPVPIHGPSTRATVASGPNGANGTNGANGSNGAPTSRPAREDGRR